MKFSALAAAFFLSTSALGALPGVTEFRAGPEKITDAELAAVLRAHVDRADVVAIGETVHGSAGFLKVQARLIRYLVENHGLRLIVWENPAIRSLELARWVASCTAARSPPPIDVLYWPTPSDRVLWSWVCDFNFANPREPIVMRGMDIWDRPWEHYSRIQKLGARAGIEAPLLRGIDRDCPASRASSWAEIDLVHGRLQRDGRFPPESGYEKCRAVLTALLDASTRAATDRKKAGDPAADEAYELAISASTLLGWLGFYHYNWSDDILSWNERDRAQGRNLALVMAKHGAARAIVSAHTSHVSHGRSPTDWWGYGDFKSGIHFFAAATQKKVFNIALTAYEASGSQGEWSLPVAVNSMDRKLHEAKHVFSFFAAGAAFLSEHPKWWMQNGNFPGPYESGVEIVPKDHFDAYLFLDRSHADELLPARSIWQY